jgi:hypothetical protein
MGRRIRMGVKKDKPGWEEGRWAEKALCGGSKVY